MSHPIVTDADPEGGAEVNSAEWKVHGETDAIIVKPLPTEKLAPADLASWRTISVAATDTQPQPILGQDNKRHRAYIKVTGAAAANNVILARQKQMSNAGNGFTLFAGDSVTTEAASELWLVPTGTAVTVSILEERYVR